jgi:4-oxalocrotonate tautomerase
MPLVRIDLRRGKSAAYKKAISDAVYEDFLYEPNYLGIAHSADFIMLQITVTNTRTVEQKKALHARIVELLEKNPSIRRQDVMINLIDVGKENWSFRQRRRAIRLICFRPARGPWCETPQRPPVSATTRSALCLHRHVCNPASGTPRKL